MRQFDRVTSAESCYQGQPALIILGTYHRGLLTLFRDTIHQLFEFVRVFYPGPGREVSRTAVERGVYLDR